MLSERVPHGSARIVNRPLGRAASDIPSVRSSIPGRGVGGSVPELPLFLLRSGKLYFFGYASINQRLELLGFVVVSSLPQIGSCSMRS